ncbi:hypothetical protein D5H75_15010 [Bailinhaonella thermotolerans]|uniref:Uncharacterized protein n=1 Tax=Bailinhaonella thermotolerans TaxID=1070861 RepID=A0A3A4AZE5_9ACTN|nr:hypothetical protein D5H75_15010 [Bailinhaonella thermotolerans]
MAAGVISATSLLAGPAQAFAPGSAPAPATASARTPVTVSLQSSAQAAKPCPLPTKADIRRSAATAEDRPPRKGTNALKGVRVGYVPKGFVSGGVTVNRHKGLVEYSYTWTDDRSDMDYRRRTLWVRVVCAPKATKLDHLRKTPFDLGSFGNARQATYGGRRVLTQSADGALGHGRYLGWVERPGTIVTVLASQPLVPQLNKIVKGIRLP